MSPRSAVSALVVVLLAAFPAGARADAWTISYEPASPAAGQEVAFHADRTGSGKPGGGPLIWDFGDGTGDTGAGATHTYAAAGEYTVTLSSTGSDGAGAVEDSVVLQVAEGPPPPPPENSPPSAAFTFSPANPLVGEDVIFTGGSDPDGDPISRVWDFGDLTPVSHDQAPVHAYAGAGSYTVALSVTDDRGGFDSSSRDITVSPREASQPAAPVLPDPVVEVVGSDPKPLPVRMKPFPVVRMAGVILPRGALVTILSVRAPRGARTLVRCAGRSCPARTMTRRSATRVVRFHRFERRLAAGTTIELFVRKRGLIGKYTRFRIRAGKSPTRVDRCLMPGRTRPGRCG